MPQKTSTTRLAACCLSIWMLACPLLAWPVAEAEPSGLPPLPAAWLAANPYRGNAQAIAAGASAYGQHCATCHGAEGARTVPEAPDLRRLNSFCNRLNDGQLQAHCLRDVDAYFAQSVREGKLRAGLRHMPSWEGVLPQATLWAIRSFIESRPLPPARNLPDLPPGGAKVTR